MKRAIILLLILSLTLTLVACSDEREDAFLTWINGMHSARTVDELTPYVHSSTPDSAKQTYMDALLEIDNSIAKGFYSPFDFPCDSAELTLVDTYKGYEIYLAKIHSSEYKAWMEALAPYVSSRIPPIPEFSMGVELVPLTMEEGHYVTTLDEAFLEEVRSLYAICPGCRGYGETSYPDVEPCPECGGKKPCPICEEILTDGICGSCLCPDCGINLTYGICTRCGEFPEAFWEKADHGNYRHMSTCATCNGTGRAMIEGECIQCLGEGYLRLESHR